MAQENTQVALWTLRAFFAFIFSISAQAFSEKDALKPQQEEPKNLILNEDLVMENFLIEALMPILKLTERQRPEPALSIWDSAEPAITLERYFSRFSRYARLPPAIMIMTLIYIDRLMDLTTITLSKYNVHRIFLLANVLAQKYLFENESLENSYMARLGGLPTRELNELEREFLKNLDYQLYVSPEHFQKYVEQFLATIRPKTSEEIHEKYRRQLSPKDFIY